MGGGASFMLYPMPGSVWFCTVASAWKGGYRPRSYRAGGYAIPFLRSCRGTRRTRTLCFSLLRCGERPGRHPDVASGGYSYPAPVNAAPPVVSRWRNMRSASQTLHGVRRRTPSPIASPPPAHSRLVFKSSSLKGKQRRALERVNKDAAYISRGSAHLCVDRTPYEPSPGLYSR